MRVKIIFRQRRLPVAGIEGGTAGELHVKTVEQLRNTKNLYMHRTMNQGFRSQG